jgi:hypothetical protein
MRVIRKYSGHPEPTEKMPKMKSYLKLDDLPDEEEQGGA